MADESDVAKLRQKMEADADFLGWLKHEVAFLEASEIDLIRVMKDNGLWDGPVPDKPKGVRGDIDFGLVPYFLHNPPGAIREVLQSSELLQTLWRAVTEDVPTRLSTQQYDALKKRAEHGGVVAEDGGIYAEGTYDLLDPGWLYAPINDILTRWLDDVVPYPEPRHPVQVQPLRPIHHERSFVRVALLSDWGTGQHDPAGKLMRQLMAHAPDAVVHLGDVYYSGTGDTYEPKHEMQRNFLDLWPDTDQLPAGRSFTLNGNHEMYAGGHGYFEVALRDARFAAQQGVGYFALGCAGWTILGLDSAYHSKSELYMTGNLGGSDSQQVQWLESLNLDPRRTIVLTHHNPMDLTGSHENALWQQVRACLGGDPAVWYWGHIHYGVAYTMPTAAGRRTYARCIGHGALPYAKAPVLERACGDDGGGHCHAAYWAGQDRPHMPEQQHLPNGFAILDIGADGTITETLHELGTPEPVFTNRVPAS